MNAVGKYERMKRSRLRGEIPILANVIVSYADDALDELEATIETMRVQAGDLVRCEGCGSVWDAADSASEGWHRTADDCDLCPECWGGWDTCEREKP